MKMNLTIAAATAFFAASVQAAVFVNSYEEGKDKAGEDGFIVVAYPDGWNAKNTKLAKAILASKEFAKAAGDAVILEQPIPNISTPEDNEARKQKFGPIQTPNTTGATLSYPCIYLCDKEGRNYAMVNADQFRDLSLPKDEMTKTAIDKAGKEVAARLAAVKEQRFHMDMAAKTSGKAAADQIFKACCIPGINKPDKVVDAAKKADPEDKTGIVTALTHNVYGFMEDCGNAGADNWEEKLARAEELMKNPYFDTATKQTLYTSAFGLLRRNGGSANHGKMMGYLETMYKLDPKSIYGESYAGAMRLWDSWSTKWSPETIPAQNGPMDVPAPNIKEPGVYTVTFSFNSGLHGFSASAVELYDGDTKVAEDVHDCFAGSRCEGNVYTLQVSKKLAKPHLKVMTTMGANRNSHGTISIMQQ